LALPDPAMIKQRVQPIQHFVEMNSTYCCSVTRITPWRS
jgi:hypothetical protein